MPIGQVFKHQLIGGRGVTRVRPGYAARGAAAEIQDFGGALGVGKQARQAIQVRLQLFVAVEQDAIDAMNLVDLVAAPAGADADAGKERCSASVPIRV